MARDRTEVSFEAPIDEVRVLDGYCSAHGLNRTTAMRQILKEWSDRQLHVATVICRVVGRHPTPSEGGRG
jgi:hypothetical protein